MFLIPRKLHFTGIGGIGMSGLAELCAGAGCSVSGSDVNLSAVTARLEAAGIHVAQGHAAGHVPADAEALIVTSAARADNPEVMEARRRGLSVARRGELLAELMRRASGVAVGGSHGKTTTTSMIAHAALELELDPTVFVGTLAPFLDGSNARLGGELFVAECDESDGSFLELSPRLAVITNIDKEHLDHYGTFDNVRAAFARFANRTELRGAVVACLDDPAVRSILGDVRRRVVSYGRSEDAMLRITQAESGAAGSRFTLQRDGRALGEFQIHVPGTHNVLNATAAVAVLMELGVDARRAATALEAYRGTGRRMELKGEARGVTVLDDYGHHPTEVRATLEALRLRKPKRLVVLFQPHRYTRTQSLLREFEHAFDAADMVRVLDIYAASEPPIEGVTGAALAARVTAAGHPDCRHLDGLEEAARTLARELRAGDLVLTLGAGSVTRAGAVILNSLLEEAPDGGKEKA